MIVVIINRSFFINSGCNEVIVIRKKHFRISEGFVYFFKTFFFRSSKWMACRSPHVNVEITWRKVCER